MNTDPKYLPWHPNNCPLKPDPANPTSVTAREEWSQRCKAWMEELARTKPEQTLRTHLKCSSCGFGFIVRTSYYSMGSDSDVYNDATCLNPDCRSAWEEVS